MPRSEPFARGRAAVASPHRAATAVGAEVLAEGGNAIDAAVAVNAMLAVAYPHMCGLGGDLLLLHYEARSGRVSCLNGTGGAPRLASRDAFRDRGLEAVPARGPLAATVPGAVAGWMDALRRFGTRDLGTLLLPALEAAERGLEVTARVAGWIDTTVADLRRDPVLAQVFLDDADRPLEAGATLRQPKLARTLRRLCEAGGEDFYRGEIADEIDRAFRGAGGLLRRADLEAHGSEWCGPIRVPYRGLDIVTTPPNSQGLTSLIMLNALTELGAERLVPGTADHVDALVAAKLAAFRARDAHIADPRFSVVPVEQLLSADWVRHEMASPGTQTAVDRPVGGDTVYLCTVDAEGNACSAIQSIYYGFGSCFVAGDTGVLMHNRGHSFSLDDGPNRLEPEKRPMHTLMASLALEAGRPRFVFGSMGADGQPQFNVQVLERLLSGLDPEQAVAAPRVLHGRFVLEDDPEILHVEADIGDAALEQLEARGHRLQLTPALDERMGHAHAIGVEPGGTTTAGSDPRSDGTAFVAA